MQSACHKSLKDMEIRQMRWDRKMSSPVARRSLLHLSIFKVTDFNRVFRGGRPDAAAW
jgi:hypothetical protein